MGLTNHHVGKCLREQRGILLYAARHSSFLECSADEDAFFCYNVQLATVVLGEIAHFGADQCCGTPVLSSCCGALALEDAFQ